jgi:hypothetical protein
MKVQDLLSNGTNNKAGMTNSKRRAKSQPNPTAKNVQGLWLIFHESNVSFIITNMATLGLSG